MKEYTADEMKKIYKTRCNRIYEYLQENKIGSCVFIDSESHRDVSIRYLTGHPSDAVLIFFENKKNVLIPWDEILARKFAIADRIVPYTKYKNSDIDAVKSILNSARNVKNMKTELPPYLTYIDFLKFVDALPLWDCRCKEDGVHKFVTECRMCKDEYEIDCIKEACRIGDEIIKKIEEDVKSGAIKTETDVALLIEKELRLRGCEKTGFDTLAAGPSRSWAIHAFPSYTQNEWPADGLSILDFGVVYNGYTSDTTLTIAKGKLSDGQEKLLCLVQEAFDECLKLYKKDLSLKDACQRAELMFSSANKKMPHTLGHAIGLEIHEYPRVSTKMSEDVVFKPGMVLTLEPGLYDEKLGGVRLENDVLITEEGNEVLTKSKIIRI